MAIGYGTDKPDFWLSTFEGMGPNREVHIAFTAPDADAGARLRRGRPRPGAPRCCTSRGCWPEYHEAYYGGFVRDPDGNNVEAVCHRGRPGD